MSHPLLEKLSAVRRRARRLLVLYGASWVLAAVLMTVVLAGLGDFLFRFEDPGIRLIVSAVVAGVLVWSVSRYLWPAMRTRLTDLDVALRIERRYPELAERLSSTVQFLHEEENDPTAGSALLRRSVITQTTSQLESYDLRDAVQSRPTWRVALVAVGVLLITGTIAAWSPELSRIALARLVSPLGTAAWPQQHHLQWREEVRRVALGQPLELAVVDARGARLPAEVQLRLRFAAGGDETTEDVVNMQFVDGAFVYRQESVTRPFEYKAEGGDDASMPWTSLEVVEPPSVESLAVKLHPPAYTGWPSETADKHFRALKGTRVEIHATSTKPLKAAALRLESGQQIAGRVIDDGYGLVVPATDEEPFVVEQTGSYSFLLTDREGFEGGAQERYEIRVTPDLPPAVTFGEPKNSLFVTPDAVVPLVISAKDDLAIRDVALEFLRSDTSEQGETRIELFAGPQQLAPSTAAVTESMGDSRLVKYSWNLAELELKPGVQVTFQGAAGDYLPQIGRSSPMRLTIITPQELNDRIAQRQTYLLGELARVLKMQQDSRSQVSSVEIQWQDVGRLNKPDVDHLQAAELAQRQVNRTLTDPDEGVPGLIQGLLDDLKNNKVDSPEVERRMQGLLGEIERIDREHLATIDRELNSAIKGAQSNLPEENTPSPPADPAVGKSLTAAGNQQDEVIASLEQMLGELAQWDNYRRFHRDITQLKTEQEEIARETSEVGRETISKDARDLTNQQQADLKKLSQRQQELGRRFDKLQQQMGEMGDDLEKSDPLAAGVIEDALHQSRQQGISGQMREAGESVEQNQVGQAGQRQQQIGEDLQEMLDTLANRSEHELSRLVQKLREAESELASLREKQQGLRKKIDEAAKNPDEAERRQELERLSRQQQELEQEAQRMARKLQRLQAEQASRSTSRASGQMAQAGQQGEQGNAGEAGDAAEAAEKDLDEAQQALAERRRQAEIDLAMEQLAKIEDGLKSMHQRQQEVVLETVRLENLKQQNGKWTRGQTLSVRDLARQQTALHDETGELSKKLEAAEVFALALKGAAREMLRAVEQLEARDTGELAQYAENNALRRFEQLLESLKPDKPEAGDQKQQGEGQGGEQGGQQPPGDGIPSLAQLKMLKLMQLEINERTKGLEEQFAKANELTPEQQQEYAALGEEQSQLADLVLNLSKPKESSPEDDPSQLPELKLDEPKPKRKTLEELLLPSDDESSSR